VSDYKLMSVHSFTNTLPETQVAELANTGWEIAYSGYSFAFQVGAGRGYGTALQGHGSCLREFSPIGIAQTNGQEVRWISPNFKSLWVIDYGFTYGDDDEDDYDWAVDTPADREKFIQERVGKCYVVKKSVSMASQRGYSYYTDEQLNR